MYSETKQKISLVSSHCTATKPNVSTNNSNKCKNINLLKNTQILIELECSDEPKLRYSIYNYSNMHEFRFPVIKHKHKHIYFKDYKLGTGLGSVFTGQVKINNLI